MSHFKRDLPRSRINITLDLEGLGGRHNTELPFHVLVLGDFSGQQGERALERRKKYKISPHNFDDIMRQIQPTVHMAVSDPFESSQSTDLTLQFRALKDFAPDSLIRRIPHLRRMLGMRNLLKDFRAQLIDDPLCRKKMEQVLTCSEKNHDI